ncbi:hypothetical protein NMG60_11034801 [Bertholletia excelsa]
MDVDKVGIMEPYELRFSDLVRLSSDNVSSSSGEIERLGSIARSIMENLGPTGPGLITITGVPDSGNLRRTLLPLARRLALLNAEDRKRVLKEHGLGSDVPLKNLDRDVSSFAMQLKYVQGVKSSCSEAGYEGKDCHDEQWPYPAPKELGDIQDSGFKNLGSSFKELGFCMMELGLCLARICDKALGGQELEQSLLESGTAKGRLIHYHSILDNLILKEAARKQQSAKREASQQSSRNWQPIKNGNECNSSRMDSNLWQQWHYDYGIFTVLTAPFFVLPHHKHLTGNGCFCISCEQEYSSPIGHSYLKTFHLSKNEVQMVKVPLESFIIQVGEAAQILSNGKLQANLHSVCRPANEDLSRETFVVFLQPAWGKTFSLSDYAVKSFQSDLEGTCIGKLERGKLAQELHQIVPPLSLRLKDGMTFAEFSRETTQQYYGGSGLQSRR